MEPINVQQAFATMFALITLVGIVPNLFWFNWQGIACAAVGALLAYNFPGGAFYWMFFGLVGAGAFYVRARAHA